MSRVIVAFNLLLRSYLGRLRLYVAIEKKLELAAELSY